MAQTGPGADLPDWLSPVFIREFRRRTRADHFTGLFLTIHGISLASVGAELYFGHFLQGLGIPGLEIGGLLAIPLYLVFGLLLPRSYFSALQPEVGIERNMELLAVSNLSRWSVIRGQYFHALAISILLLVSLVPYFLVQPFAGTRGLGTSLASLYSLASFHALMTAFFLGASAYRGYLSRFFVIAFLLVTFLVSLAFLGIAPAATGGSPLPRESGFLLCSTLFVLLALQLGRSRIVICSNPLEPPSSAIVLLLIFCTPVLLGMGSQILAGWGSWGISILSIVGLLFFDRDRASRLRASGRESS